MKQKTIAILLLCSTVFPAVSQKHCDIVAHYDDFISVEKMTYGAQSFVICRAVETNKKRCYSDLVNNSGRFIDYLLTNFSAAAIDQSLAQQTDSIAMRKAFFDGLKNDSGFNALMTGLVAKTIDKNMPKDSVTVDKLLNIAVKFFSIIRLNAEGHYVGKVCAGLNDIRATETERQPFVEAFCFSSIQKHYRGSEFAMYDEFVKAVQELYSINLGIDNNEKLLRAQGGLFLLMRNNANLRLMLQTEYARQKAYLPFVLVDE